MRKTRKVTFQIEHREITISTVRTGALRPNSRSGRQEEIGAPDAELPSTCPSCGDSGVLPLAAALAEPDFTLELLRQSVDGRRIHLGQTSAGEWWVCRQSLHNQ